MSRHLTPFVRGGSSCETRNEAREYLEAFIHPVPSSSPRLTCVIRQVGFEDVIAEPLSSHSFDKVWIGSHAAFELVKFLFYRLLTTLLAVPMAFLLGLLFGLLSCIHIW